MSFLLLKQLHVLCVASAFALLFIRGMWVTRAYPPAQELWVKVLPHAVDTLLVLAAVGMLVVAPHFGWPLWLQVKLVLLALYVLLTLVAFKLGRSRLQKAAAWLGAMFIVLFITTVAVLRDPIGIFSIFW